MMQNGKAGVFFALFKEIGIIEQLSRTLLESRLPDGLIAPHFGVLQHLTLRGDGKTPLDIARAFQVPKTTMTHTLQGLERRALIEMRPNPADGRSKLVFLTAAGRAALQDIYADMADHFAPLFEGLDADAVQRILPELTALREYLDDRRVVD